MAEKDEEEAIECVILTMDTYRRVKEALQQFEKLTREAGAMREFYSLDQLLQRLEMEGEEELPHPAA